MAVGVFNVALVLPGVQWGLFLLGRRFTVESFGLCMRWMKKPVPDHAVQWSAVCVLVLSN